ncbi:hypothetical protein BJP36_43710 [Moorena producens JHB]|uniref:Uncharacterized protein n=1 Tax=Moorena producens (strain JHB) TaxID=1454205 RepID=A0A9Q9STB3_MOOP1|nr:hypothetical protein [Moorena producens]WAN69270.1 hypothetical protein BJP36_43710 [Moorena producens JHB]
MGRSRGMGILVEQASCLWWRHFGRTGILPVAAASWWNRHLACGGGILVEQASCLWWRHLGRTGILPVVAASW